MYVCVTCIYVRVCVCTCMYVCVYVYGCMQPCMYVCMHVCPYLLATKPDQDVSCLVRDCCNSVRILEASIPVF